MPTRSMWMSSSSRLRLARRRSWPRTTCHTHRLGRPWIFLHHRLSMILGRKWVGPHGDSEMMTRTMCLPRTLLPMRMAAMEATTTMTTSRALSFLALDAKGGVIFMSKRLALSFVICLILYHISYFIYLDACGLVRPYLCYV